MCNSFFIILQAAVKLEQFPVSGEPPCNSVTKNHYTPRETPARNNPENIVSFVGPESFIFCVTVSEIEESDVIFARIPNNLHKENLPDR